MQRSLALVSALALALALALPLSSQQLQFSPDQGRDATEVLLSLGVVTLVDLDGDGFDDAISPGPVVHLLDPATGSWISWLISSAGDVTTVADINGDTFPDLISLSSEFLFPSPNILEIHLNDGTGQFTALPQPSLFSSEIIGRIAAADLDGDTDTDLLVGAQSVGGSRIYYLKNDGAGAMSVHATIPMTSVSWPTVLDFDGDGDPDVLAPQAVAPAIYLRNDAGTLNPVAGVLPTEPRGYNTFHPVDLDGNGAPDVLGRTAAGAVDILLHRGTFLEWTGSLIGNWDQVVVGDFDGNGSVDAATREADHLALHRGQGDGTFQPPEVQLRRTLDCRGLAAGNLDGNAATDLMTVWRRVPFELGLPVYGAAVGSMVSDPHAEHDLQLVTAPRFQATAGDINGDGLADAVLSLNGNIGPFLSVQLGLGEQRFRGIQLPHPSTDTVLGIALANLDGDSDLDIVEQGSSRGSRYVRIWENAGDEIFLNRGNVPFAGGATQLGDVDGDGDPDLITSVSSSPLLHRNDGSGNFHAFEILPGTAGANTRVFGLGDIDGDGDLDVVAGRGNPGLDTLLNDGSGTFTLGPSGALPYSGAPWGLELADADANGSLDVFLFEIPENLPRLFVNDGSGQFTERTATDLPPWPGNAEQIVDLLPFDADGDGDNDLLIAQLTSQVLYLNDGSGVFADVTAARWEGVSLGTELAAADFDNDGDTDVLTNGQIQWNHQRQLVSLSAPRLGGSIELRGVQDPGNAAAGSTMIGIVAFAPLATPLTVAPFRGQLQVDLTVAVAVPMAVSIPDGESALSIPIPMVPALVGADVYLQSAVASFTSGSLGFTNALVQRVLP